ncbi:hypothetical protein D3C72_2514050 [compost metagenome]
MIVANKVFEPDMQHGRQGQREQDADEPEKLPKGHQRKDDRDRVQADALAHQLRGNEV